MIGMLISNKSSFKIIFNLLSFVVIYLFFELNNYPYSKQFLAFAAMILMLIICFVKFSQTGKLRVYPTNRNRRSQNLSPLVSLIATSLFVLIVIAGISDEMLKSEITAHTSMTLNYLDSNNIKFVGVYSLFLLILVACKKVSEK
jgi:hypothetical protein